MDCKFIPIPPAIVLAGVQKKQQHIATYLNATTFAKQK